jgi:hypothetical protein
MLELWELLCREMKPVSEHLSPESRNLCTRRKVNVVLAKRPTCHAIANTMSDEVVCPKTLMNIKGSLILILRSRVVMIIITALRIMKNFLNPCVTHCQTVDTVRLRRRQGNTRVSIHIAMPINSRCPLVPAWCQRHPLIALTSYSNDPYGGMPCAVHGPHHAIASFESHGSSSMSSPFVVGGTGLVVTYSYGPHPPMIVYPGYPHQQPHYPTWIQAAPPPKIDNVKDIKATRDVLNATAL